MKKNKTKFQMVIVSIALYLILLSDLFLINDITMIGFLMIVALSSIIILSNKYPNERKKWVQILILMCSISAISEFLWLIFKWYPLYIIAAILAFITVVVLWVDNFNWKINTLKKRQSLILISLRGILLGIICLPMIFLMVTAITPKPMITYFQKNTYHVENSYKATSESKVTSLKKGQLYINDICYGEEFPNSYLDIYLSNNDSSIKRPTIILIHGGGFVWGDKAEGDPNAENSDSWNYTLSFVDAGYNVVSLNYALAPEYKYPTPMYQITQAIKFLLANERQYGIDMSEVIFCGGSAGGQLIGQFLNIQTNSEYAQELGIKPILDKEKIKAAIFLSALLDSENAANTGFSPIDYLFLQCGRSYFGGGFLLGRKNVIQSDVIKNATADFPASYISDGNFATFDSQAKIFHAKLSKMGVRNYFNYHNKSEVQLFHGYEANGLEYARDNFEKQLEFLSEVIRGK